MGLIKNICRSIGSIQDYIRFNLPFFIVNPLHAINPNSSHSFVSTSIFFSRINGINETVEISFWQASWVCISRSQNSNEKNGFCFLLEITWFVKAAIIRNKENTFSRVALSQTISGQSCRRWAEMIIVFSLVPKFSVTGGRGNKTGHDITNKLLTFDSEQNQFLTSMPTIDKKKQENFVRQVAFHI
jgi:hypothetical protein